MKIINIITKTRRHQGKQNKVYLSAPQRLSVKMLWHLALLKLCELCVFALNQL